MQDTIPNAALGAGSTGITRAAVIGAGSMGGGIAAQFANAGIPVDLLDLPGAPGPDRDAPAEAGIARQLALGGFTIPEAVALVRPGNVDDDLGRLAEADWIVEAVLEDVTLKRDLYRRIAPVLKPGAILSSNTSTLLRATLTDGLPADVAARFVITHFFNPPRHMELLELVAGPDTARDVTDRVQRAGRALLGKTVVTCRDTPGFIANRIGCYWMAVAAMEAERQGLRIEEADAVLAVFGVPRTGIFGLLDLVGLDLVPPVWGSLARSLPPGDAIHLHDLSTHGTVLRQIAAGRLGRKSDGGFFRRSAEGEREALDLATGTYRPLLPVRAEDLPGGGRDPAALMADPGRLGRYAWSVVSRLVGYAATTMDEIAPDAAALDTAVALGYGWRKGPFALAADLGAAGLAARLAAEGRPVPPALLASLPAAAPRPAAPRLLHESPEARVEQAGDGIGLVRLTAKMGVIGPATFDALEAALDRAGQDLSGIVVAGSSRRAFSAGVNLQQFLALMDDPATLDAVLARGQRVFLRLRHAPVPVVAAVRGLALGGGCELMLHCTGVAAHVETRIGLPEARLGLLPGWGGTTRMLQRALVRTPGDPAEAAAHAFALLHGGNVAANAREAQALGYLDPDATIVMHADDVEAAAIALARSLSAGHWQTPDAALPVAGDTARSLLTLAAHAAGDGSDWQDAVAAEIAGVLTGAGQDVTARPVADFHALERAAVLRLVGHPQTRPAIEAIMA